ncbi:NYN domain-containing protein [archaeon]|nr:MAG: NYN domain-containing protein [archaeon]
MKETEPVDKEQRVALMVDGPNMLRKEFMIDLRELRKRAQKYGRLVIMRVFVNQFAPEKLVEAVINEGYECNMTLAEQDEEASDIDIAMAVAGIEAVLMRDIDVLALATRDADFLPVVQKAREYGKKVVIFGAEPGFSASLQNAADFVENM